MPRAPPPDGRLRILCLHGAHQTDSIFRQRIQRLEAALRDVAALTFVTGPLELPPADAGSAPLNTWYSETSGGSSLAQLAEIWAFDGVLGFSAGAATAMAVSTRPKLFPGLRFAILAGAPEQPAPSDAEFWGSPAGAQPLSTPSLFFVSPEDAAVPMASSLAASRRFVNPRVHEHDKGHALPTRQIDSRAVAEFLAQFARPEATADADADTLASWAEELATLEAIYGDDFAVDDDHPDAAALAELTAPAAVSVAFSVRLDGAGADPGELPPGERCTRVAPVGRSTLILEE